MQPPGAAESLRGGVLETTLTSFSVPDSVFRKYTPRLGKRRAESGGPCSFEGEEKKVLRSLALLGLLAAIAQSSSSTALAHHAFAAEFDINKPVRLVGTITRVEWQNPHTWFYIDVAGDGGDVASWGMELASPNLLMRNGWTRDSMKVGDVVTVEGYQAKNGRNIGNARNITLNATGRSLFTGTSAPGNSAGSAP